MLIPSKKCLFGGLLFFFFFAAEAQTALDSTAVVDSLYREDQVYLGFTYNIVSGNRQELPVLSSPEAFTLDLLGIFHINERRNIAFGLGLGMVY